MEAIQKMGWAQADSWWATIASLAPLWLVSLAVTVEGFPKPPVSPDVAIAAFFLALVASARLLWMGWMRPEVLLFTLFPLVLMPVFDEISTSYKTPFIMLCALLWSIGLLAFQRSGSVTWGWLVLFTFGIAGWVFATHAAANFWQMASDLGFGNCFPDYTGCPPLTGHEPPWWALFFKL